MSNHIKTALITGSSSGIGLEGGVHALTTSMAAELAKDNIRVNAVAPGVIRGRA